MPTLRLTQTPVSPDRFRVEAALEGDGLPRQTATVEFDFIVTRQEQEDLRWYLEDYLQHDADPAPKIAARIEGRISEIGVGLFKALFQVDDDARDLWATLRGRLNNTRVEIIAGVREATALPWELLRDPKTDAPLALRSSAFVRAAHQVAQLPRLPQGDTVPIRILLVICRPRGIDDVPFRSVASRLIKGLSESAREAFQLDVLRPPTFAQLSKVLRAAKAEGKPYHVVHFDGHGTYEEVSEPGGRTAPKRALTSQVLSGARSGAHGYLLFENPGLEENSQLVDGPALGKLLAETDVPVLVLNACRSAHAEAPALPPIAQDQIGSHSAAPQAAPSQDVHTKVRAFGSLAQEVVDAGVAGVVAMRYNVYVVTAAQFVADLYESLASGKALGEAVTLGRKQLEAQPLREIAYQPRPLQDWMVPVVYEAAPFALFPKPAQKVELKITVSADAVAPVSGGLAPELERRPDVGFFGRDETLLALDRAFDTQAIVLLHAFAGSGKTSTAAEFARWYHLTGGLEGPVLFTSFEHYKSLAQMLNETIGRVFADALETSGIHWLALTDRQRLEVALQVMAQIPVLWIWDNVEPIAGFPTGTKSSWSDVEQQALADFLRAASQTKAKFLLTSRRDERGWLGEALPRRIVVPPMPMQERVQLARALAEKYGRRLTDVEDWVPLLRFTGGNPLTVTVLVGQALRDGWKTKAQIEAFVVRLRAGEAAFEDEESEGRDKSLGVSLSYGFEHAFSEAERKQLALLHFFQGFVDVDAFCVMGDPSADWCLPELRGLTRDAGIDLLDRAAEIGLLTAQNSGYYVIHPALPWFFKNLFDIYYPAPPVPQPAIQNPQLAASQAFVEAMAKLGDFYHREASEGNHDVIAVISAEEANLLHGWQLARQHGWWDALVSHMQGLFVLYDLRGRWTEWEALVDESTPHIIDPVTNQPLPGREEIWRFIIDFRVRVAFERRQLDVAERLQRARVEWSRRRAAPFIDLPDETLQDDARNQLRSLAVSLGELGLILRERGDVGCAEAFREAIDLSSRIDDFSTGAIHNLNLGVAYLILPKLEDLEEAKDCFLRGLELVPKRDQATRSKFFSELGFIAITRFKEAVAARESSEVINGNLNEARRLYEEALALTPPDAVASLQVKHQALGVIYNYAGELGQSLRHFREAISCSEIEGNLYKAAGTRINIALALMQADSLPDAREYAYAALRNYEAYGDRATDKIQGTQELIAEIEQLLQSRKADV